MRLNETYLLDDYSKINVFGQFLCSRIFERIKFIWRIRRLSATYIS